MPKYEYHCRDCDSDFFIFCGMNDKRDNVICDKCKNNNVFRIYSNIMTKSKSNINSLSSSSTGSSCGSCSKTSCSSCH